MDLLFALHFADVLATGIWQELDKFTDPQLRQLARVVHEADLGSKADSTTAKYLGALKHWKAWAKDHKLPVFPVKLAHFMVYLQHINETTKSKAALDVVFNAIVWAHAMGHQSKNYLTVSATLHRLQRNHANPVAKISHLLLKCSEPL